MTQTFNAEYGGHGGAVIDMVTKSGSNQFHGSLWESHRDASLDAKNTSIWADSPIPPFVRNQFGTGIGGPLKRDRTFFFVDYWVSRSTGVHGNCHGTRCPRPSRAAALRW